MDTYNTLLGVALLLMMLAPILYINKISSKKHRDFVTKFHLTADSIDFKIDELDTWTDDSAIAINSQNDILFHRCKDNYNETLKIPFSEILDCETIVIKDNNMIKKIQLKFELKDHKTALLEFFSATEKNFVAGSEMRIAKKWASRIKQLLPVKKQLLYTI